MNGAVETAGLVLNWVVHQTGQVPNGPLWKASRLARPTGSLPGLVAEITRKANALRGTGSPPFGDQAPIGPGPVLLAAAIGGRAQAEAAARVIAAGGPSPGWHDATARHAVAAVVMDHLDLETLTDPVLRASELTAVFRHPARYDAGPDSPDLLRAEDTVERLLAASRGRDVLVAELATCSEDRRVLSWRAHLLNQWVRHDRLDLPLDVYAQARLWHASRWDAQVRAALRWHGPPTAVMKGTADYWAHVGRLRLSAKRPVAGRYDDTLRLVNRYRSWSGGSR